MHVDTTAETIALRIVKNPTSEIYGNKSNLLSPA